MKKSEENTELTWKGLKWKKQRYKKLFLLTLPNQSKDYYSVAQGYGDLFSEIIPLINELKVFTVKPIVYVALFPEEIFAEKTEVPFSWATGCVRSTNGKFTDVLCYKYSLNKKFFSFERMSSEYKLGNMHELLHIFFSQQVNSNNSPHPKSVSINKGSMLAINEGLCEFIPRIIFNFQKDMKDSTNYLLSLTEEDMVSFKDIDEHGMAYFSPEKINKNVAYASAFLGIMWLTNELSKKEDESYLNGTKELIKLITSYKNKEQIYAEIKNKTKTDIQSSKLPMLESINRLKGVI